MLIIEQIGDQRKLAKRRVKEVRIYVQHIVDAW